jgi:hypothetical protein
VAITYSVHGHREMKKESKEKKERIKERVRKRKIQPNKI